MASRASLSDDSRIIKRTLPKSLLLKDYLLDDLSSCSSNGFRSYPRRQCCTTVRFLIEIDVNKHIKLPPSQKRPPVLKNKLEAKSPSVLHRASAAVINAFKRLPFTTSTATGGKPRKANFLPRSLSRKLLKHAFWKRATDHQNKKEIRRLKSFGELMEEKEEIPPPTQSGLSTTDATNTVTAELNSSTSNSNSNSWSDSDFTATSDSFTTVNLEVTLAQNDIIQTKRDLPVKKKTTNGKRVGVTTAATATNYSAAAENVKKRWHNEEKEQFSPVSVMDFPCDGDADDEDEVSSPCQHRLTHDEGTKSKLIHKIRRLKNLTQLEPVKLEDRIALSESDTYESKPESPSLPCLEPPREEKQTEKKAVALLQLMTSTISSRLLESMALESLLLGFFTDRIAEGSDSDYEMLQVAKDWMSGQPKEMSLDWNTQKNRLAYIREMEKGVKWSKYGDDVQKAEVCLELEHEVFTSLVDEILLDFHL